MKKHLFVMTVAAASLMVASCESLGTLNRVSSNQANVATATYPATVVSVTNTTIDTSSTAKNLGTGVGVCVCVYRNAVLCYVTSVLSDSATHSTIKKKKRKNVTCSDVDGLRDYLPK